LWLLPGRFDAVGLLGYLWFPKLHWEALVCASSIETLIAIPVSEVFREPPNRNEDGLENLKGSESGLGDIDLDGP
jgi:hypothetical protein